MQATSLGGTHPGFARLPRAERAQAVRKVVCVAQLVQEGAVQRVEPRLSAGLPAPEAAGAAAGAGGEELRPERRRGRSRDAVVVRRRRACGEVAGGPSGASRACARAHGIGVGGSGSGSLLLRRERSLSACGLCNAALEVRGDAAGYG